MTNLDDYKWNTPDSYGGYDPVGDIVIRTQSRDSSLLEQSNYQAIFAHLVDFSKQFGEPIDTGELDATGNLEWRDWVYDFRAGHWGCGWVETLLVRPDAPQKLLDEVEGILCALADYPVFDEEHYCNLQSEESDKFWLQLSLDERVELCRDMGCSIFQARHDTQPTDGHVDMCQFYDFLN